MKTDFSDEFLALYKKYSDNSINPAEYSQKKESLLNKYFPKGESKPTSDSGFIKGIFSSITTAISDSKAKSLEKKRLEDERISNIRSGNINPIACGINLVEGESCYYMTRARRYAFVEKVIQKTTTQSKKKGVLGRAVVGGVLLGPLGAVAGAATAGSKGRSQTTENVVEVIDKIDEGKIYFTNMRFIFIGDELVSLNIKDIISTEFPNGRQMKLKYDGVRKGEYYQFMDLNFKDAGYYWEGIKKLTR